MIKLTTQARRRMSPLELEFLLCCRYSPEPFLKISVPAGVDAVIRFTALGLIRPTECSANVYCLTQKGDYFIDHILSTPIPVERTAYQIPGREQ